MVHGPELSTAVHQVQSVRSRAHLDLFVDHAEPMMTEMIEAGATLVHATEAGEWTTRVLQDQAGPEFCVIGPD